MGNDKKHILIGCTGSVASLKIPQLVRELLEGKFGAELEITLIPTEHSLHFFKLEELPTQVKVYQDVCEWELWKGRGDPVLHIDLAKWADILVIAPLDANTLAKLATGLSDNLLTSVARAWRFPKPFLVCPAMNTFMWTHPITNVHISTLKGWGVVDIPCISKELICGDIGHGAMAEVNDIVKAINQQLALAEQPCNQSTCSGTSNDV